MSKPEIYVSVDVESDGPIPGDFSMLSLGAAAFSADGELLSTFSANLVELNGARQDPDTMKWWAQNQTAYDITRQDTVHPQMAIQNFVSWVNQLPGKPVCVCYPAGFDWLFLYWYIVHCGLKSPFSFSALDIKSYAMAMLQN